MDQHRAIKDGIDCQYPTWRQESFGGPVIVVVEGGVPVLSASRLTFGGQAGHLESSDWWKEGGPGAAVKTGRDTLEPFSPHVLGYIHVQRSFVLTGGIYTDAKAYFDAHPDEFSCFIPVEFVRCGTDQYPWRVRRRR